MLTVDVEPLLGGGDPGGAARGLGVEGRLHVLDDPGELGGVLDEVGAPVPEHLLLVGAEAADPDHQDQAEQQREDGDAGGGERDDAHGRVEVPHGLQVRRAVRR